MDSIAEFTRKYGPKNKKNNSASYKMEDWFENMFQQPKTKKSSSPRKEKAVEVAAVRSKSSSPRSKSRSSKEKSPLKEIVAAAVNLEELVVPTTRESKIRIINPLSPRTRKMRKEVSDAKLAEMLLKPHVKMASSNPLRLNMTRRPRGIDASVNIEDTSRFPLGRTMHNCGGVIPNCRYITQLNNRGSYSILYTNGTEKVFPSFAQLVTFITDGYMDNTYVPYARRTEHETRVEKTLAKNGITAEGIKTRKNNKKRKGTKRKGRKWRKGRKGIK